MSKLALTITQAGHARFTAAQVDDDIDLSISAVGLTDRAFIAAPTLTALPGEFRRVSTISGEAVGDNVVHMVVLDADAVAYTVRGFGLFLSDGTLFASYAQAEALFEKSALSDMHLAIDIAFPTGNVQQLVFGDTNFLNPPATTSRRGVAELATQAEVDAGADAERIVTPRTLGQRLASLFAGRRILGGGLVTGGGDLSADRTLTVTAATAEEADAGTLTARALTPASIVNVLASIAARVPVTRRINTDGLALGGATLATDPTISVPPATPEQLLNAMASNVAVTPASFGGLAKLFEPTGYYTLPGGLIVQWVTYRALLVDEPSVSLNYPIAFPNACLFALACPYIAAASQTRDGWTQIVGNPGAASCLVQVQADDQNDRRIDGINLLVIGR
ncbi:gp53-like domain-containing protein [Sphingomonas sp. 3-13AW]|uniref:gp53-like domain-containing protein n=1 Tax=Sphingomonas sp. 3-13AW TaxID=3050450 RepID=UPI003BB4FC06